MNNYVNLLSRDFKKIWGGLGVAQKLTIIGLVIATAVAISYFIAKSTEPNWEVLYSDLTETDAIAVTENLKKAGYPYKISDDKKSILVPSEMKEDLRIMIAENDVIHDSNPGFELLDKLQLGATDFQNKLTKQRIFQGELTRTIEKISGIKKARVQLAEPDRSVFTDKDEAPSASVMLILEPGIKLKQEQIKAIKNLVAYGMPRLTPDKVFVSDQNGNVLTDEVNNENSGDIMDYKTKLEENTAKKVQKVLEKLVGSENISVEVSTVINFDSAKSTIERYIPVDGENPPAGVLSSSQTESEVYGKGDGTQATNIPVGQDKKTNYQKVNDQKSYNISKEVKQVVYAPGTLQRMTIAVALNKILTTKEKDEIKNLVISASGADLARGDVINITSMQFASDGVIPTSDAMLEQINKESQMEFIVGKIAPLAVVLILGLSALFVLKALIGKPIQGEEVYESEDYYHGEHEPELLEAANIPAIEAKLDPELERMKSDINNIIMTNPAEASRLLLSYIKD